MVRVASRLARNKPPYLAASHMARLAVKPHHAAALAQLTHGPIAVLRYGFDLPALLHWFGGHDRLIELCGIFGVPTDGMPRASVKLSTSALAAMLELAERMHRPLDLYQFVVQVR